jgi:hypothetical protein
VRPFQPPQIRDEPAVAHAGTTRQLQRDDVRVGHLRHPVGPNPGADFDHACACVRQAIDERQLVVGGDAVRLVLKTVTRPDFDERDAARVSGHKSW